MSAPADDGQAGEGPPPPDKTPPEKLELRARPRPVARFRRGVVIGAAAAGAALVMALAWLALDSGPRRGAFEPREPAIAEARAPAGVLADLPADYGALPRSVPQLGPPLPGDLGRPLLERRRELGLEPPAAGDGRAAEIEAQRLAELARRARESALLVQSPARAAPSAPAVGEAARSDPPAHDAARLDLDPARDPGAQQRKHDFVNAPPTGARSAGALQPPSSPYQVMAGSVIAASLMTGISSDLPGLVVAQVTENVYDSATGRHLLIPQGARLIGAYDSVVAFGQSRALLVWRRIVLPDGASIDLYNLPATDASGYAGLEDRVDHHTGRLLRGIALSTLLGVGAELAFDDESDLVRAMRESTQESANRAGQEIVRRNLSIQPTVTVRPGWPVYAIVHRDLTLRPWRG